MRADCGPAGFHPSASGWENAQSLQRAIDSLGTVHITCAGTFDIATTVFLSSNTYLHSVDGAMLRKVSNTSRPFAHILLNRGALSGKVDKNITIDGLGFSVNRVEARVHGDDPTVPIPGLRGQIALFHVRNVVIRHVSCLDLGAAQFAIHVCAFANLTIEDVTIRGRKDAIHLGRGHRFVIRRGLFETADDAIALNAHDYATSNPVLGWISQGLIENCTDLPLATGYAARGATSRPVAQNGFFARLLAGAWLDWFPGMLVRNSDTVVSNGAIFRVFDRPAGTTYVSSVRPAGGVLRGAIRRGADGVPWRLTQRKRTRTRTRTRVPYNAGVRNVIFRNIRLQSGARPNSRIRRRLASSLGLPMRSCAFRVARFESPRTPQQGPGSRFALTTTTSHALSIPGPLLPCSAILSSGASARPHQLSPIRPCWLAHHIVDCDSKGCCALKATKGGRLTGANVTMHYLRHPPNCSN